MRPQIIAAGTLATIIAFAQMAGHPVQAAVAAAVLKADDSRPSLPTPKAGRARPPVIITD
jgi:hypothetical protein